MKKSGRAVKRKNKFLTLPNIIFVFFATLVIIGGVAAFLLSQTNTDNRSEAYALKCKNQVLHQSYWRGNQGFTREVPILDQQPQWNLASEFKMVIDLKNNPNALPGSGVFQTSNTSIWPGNILAQTIIRGGKSYVRQVPIQNGKPNWSKAGGWSDHPDTITGKMLSGNDVISHTSQLYVDPKTMGWKFIQKTIWKGNKGYISEQRNGGDQTEYRLVIDLDKNPSALPGSGKMQTTSEYIGADNTSLNQAYWRGNQGFVRTVPVVNATPQFEKAPDFRLAIDLNKNPSALPGSGEMQVQDGYIFCR